MVVYGVEFFQCLVASRIVHNRSVVYLSSCYHFVSSRVFMCAPQLFAAIVFRMLSSMTLVAFRSKFVYMRFPR